MLLLCLIGSEYYAIETDRIVEIIPRVPLRKLHGVTPSIAGLLIYRGQTIPVVDLSYLIQEQPSRSFFSTRIMIVNYHRNQGVSFLLGLIAEGVTDIVDGQKLEKIPTEINLKDTPYLGEIMMDERRTIQKLHLDYLLSESQQAFLLPEGLGVS